MSTFLQSFALDDARIIFLSILLEALPFLLLGSLVAALIEVFLGEDVIRRYLPGNRLLQLLVASFLGLIFPLCECAIIPVARGLMRRGVPVSTALVFMFAAPVVNPVALAATYFAFPGFPEVLAYRVGMTLFVALAAALFFWRTRADGIIREGEESHHGHAHALPVTGPRAGELRGRAAFMKVIKHAKDEFLDVGVYMVAGALISALIQVGVPAGFMEEVREMPHVSMAGMQVLAYILSLCSHGDAFVAATFLGQLGLYPVLAFLVTSPLIDVKNTLVMVGLFRPSFAARIIPLVAILVFFAVFLLRQVQVP
jgi:hypothetical protein